MTMRLITALTPDPRRPARMAVVVEGFVVATLALETIDRLGIRVGIAYDLVAAAVEEESALLATYERAANMLAARARSASELRRLLIRKGEAARQVDAAIERLISQGYLDDAEFARQFARSKMLGAGHARFRLRQELARRGVERATADEAIEDVLADEAIDEDAIVADLARKKLKGLASADPPTRRRRLYGYLARRGYDPDRIRRTLDEVLVEPEVDDPSA